MDDVSLVLRIIDDTWDEVRRGTYVAVGLGHLEQLPDLSEEAAFAASARALAIIDRIAELDVSNLPCDVVSTLAVARASMERQACAGPWWWTVFDPLGVGFWAIHAPTAYGGGFLLSMVNGALAVAPLLTAADVDRYLALVDDYGRMVGQLDARTRGQAERGIHLPGEQLEQAIVLIERLHSAAVAALVRGEGGVRQRIEQRVISVVVPAFVAMHEWLADPTRRADASEKVGMAHLPDGPEIYAEMVVQHLTMDLGIDEVHRGGMERLAEIHADMQAIADELGEPDAHAVVQRLDEDPAWHADTVEGVAALFQRYIDRMAPLVDGQFRFQPRAGYGVRPLPASLSASMTFGYYDKPGSGEPTGRYLFNAANLVRQNLANVAALTFHELVPGHHLHFASQLENQALHPLRSNAFFNAFNEGWAEYAAGLANELGLYSAPEERFGRLMMDAFLTTRLVVDTGMNALGWSLERAREFMSANAFISPTEVITESMRYACDIPAQSLGYKIGEPFLLEQRTKMRAAFGARFDIRDFHDAVLRPGALPFSQVAANVDRAIAARLVEK